MASDTVLVTGGAGFIGSNATRAFIEHFSEVYVLDNLTYAGNRQNLDEIASDITFVKGKIQDRELLHDLYPKVDSVVNFAAETHVDRSISAGDPFVSTNVHGSYVAMDTLRDHDIERFIQISTDEVYGSTRSGTFSEGDKLDPSSPYSASKASADMFVHAFWETYGLPITVVRPTNVYGPRQHPEKLIPKFILRALNGEPLPVYGDGSNVRQWLYVEDFCEALLHILEDADSDVYNVSGTDEKTNLEVTHLITELVDAPEGLIEFVEDRKGHDYRYSLSDDKIQNELGFSASTDFEEGLQSTIEWYCQQEEFPSA
ncbi:dTDP-glucose 4,6-dehydratase [Halococcus sp. IIIV-5B]|uniref:dTDP-glucose 4,6-dehydratase n=1 Tax=Halococcus sp. IIIV-5B TaxID=2321230 RepID=UPI000E7233FE|nr:dTDP-glucose 4,6-dehydratase [Halococcus sp. IIIV-5B]RJS97459.1 dTDP-glucose 4,6-dehydratase [Halococcus sp. IIIV-5B]